MKKIAEMSAVIPAGRLGYVSAEADVVSREDSFPVTDYSRDLLRRAAYCYDALFHVRERRRRSRRYYRGDQWKDMVTVYENGCEKTMTEEEYIQRQGRPALKQNLIRPPVRNLIGQLRSAPYKSVIYARAKEGSLAAEMMSVALESALEMNDYRERDARLFEEFAISGCPVYETSYGWDVARQRCIPKFRAVSINRFFFNPEMSDVCGDDVDFLGEIVDVDKDELIAAYAVDEYQEAELRDIYSSVNRMSVDRRALSSENEDSLDFYVTRDPSRCRVIKVCVLEGGWMLDCHDWMDGTRTLVPISRMAEIESENAQRAAMQGRTGQPVAPIEYRRRYVRQWVYYHLSPQGNILFRKANPYEHKSHPYVFKLYPMVDGEVWSLVEDLIDQQRMINRMNILLDFVISASAKGVLLVPEEAIPDDMDIEDFAEEWSRYNGVIKIKTKGGVQIPQQVVASNFNVGITDMINRQVQWMQQIGGVQDAQYGRSGGSGTSAARYRQELMSSSLNAIDYLESFGSLLIKRDWKIVQLIKQYYTDKEYIPLAGKEYSEQAHDYDPEVIRNIDFGNTMQKMQDTFTMRFISEDAIMRLLESGMISLEQYLMVSNNMYSEKLLSQLEETKRQLAQGNVDPAMLQQVLTGVQQQTPQSSPQGLANARALFNGSIQGA